MEEVSIEQPNSSDNTPPLPTRNYASKSILIILAVVIGVALFGVGYVLAVWQARSAGTITREELALESNTLIAEPSPTVAMVVEELDASLPSGWLYKSNGECNVKFAIPPKASPYYTPSDPQKPFSMADDNGRYWGFPVGGVYSNLLMKFPNVYEQLKQVNTMYSSELEASEYISYAVSVSCIPNSNNWNNATAFGSLKDRIEEFNQKEEESMEADTYTILSTKEISRWGHNVFDLTVSQYYKNSGGEPYTQTAEYTFFSTPQYIYEIKMFGSTDNSFVQQTGQQIFDNLKFE